MADPQEILELRRLINETTNQAPWTDDILSNRIDAWGDSLSTLAAVIWREKAASFAGLIDVKEGNSDRKLSQLHKQALEMATALSGGETPTTGRRPARTRQIERL